MAEKHYKTIALNLGSTSTKVAYFLDEECLSKESIAHDPEAIAACGSDIWAQYGLRRQAVLDYIAAQGLTLDDVDIISSRGGNVEPTTGGTYRINRALRDETRSCAWGTHVSHVGVEIAYELAAASDHAVAVTCDLPTTDEFGPLARYSGLAEVPREQRMQTLNHKAMARAYAESQGRRYEDMSLIVVMLGGGITVAAHDHGRIVDGQDGLTGDGTFSNNRCCGLPSGALVDLCYSGRYTHEQMRRHINGEAGLMSYLGTTDVRALIERAQAGDEKVAEVLAAMCYQTAKDVGAFATVLKGKVDAIVLTGGMANSAYLTDQIAERVDFIAPVVVLPGEREMEALGTSAYRAVSGKEELKEFVPRQAVPEVPEPAVMPEVDAESVSPAVVAGKE